MKIFNAFQSETLSLKNRIVMAPMTRSRAINNIPNDLMVDYYQQRAGAGLIISEGTAPSANGLGYARIPGAFNQDQIEGWSKIAKAVQKEGSKLFVQLMHTGRVSSSINMPEGGKVIAPSPVQLGGEMWTDSDGMQPHDVPAEMAIKDIQNVKKEFIDATVNLINAGVDGVELHSANGYLLDQFLNPKTNRRTDEYGGHYKNRAQLLLELVSELSEKINLKKVGVRFSPYGLFNDTLGVYEDLEDLYIYLSQKLKTFGVAYIHIANQEVAMGAPKFATDITKTIKDNFGGVVIVGGDVHSADQAQSHIDSGYDLVYIGRPFISNPNLVEKLENGSELNAPNMDLFYTPGAEGYTDY